MAIHVSRCAAAALLSLLAGCAGMNYDFQGPPGWDGSPRLFGMQRYVNPADSDEYILIAQPREPRPSSHPAAETWTPIRICGGHPAMLMQKRGSLRGKDVQMDGVDASFNGSRVMAMYARPFGRPADPQAERAIRSLCIGGGAGT